MCVDIKNGENQHKKAHTRSIKKDHLISQLFISAARLRLPDQPSTQPAIQLVSQCAKPVYSSSSRQQHSFVSPCSLHAHIHYTLHTQPFALTSPCVSEVLALPSVMDWLCLPLPTHFVYLRIFPYTLLIFISFNFCSRCCCCLAFAKAMAYFVVALHSFSFVRSSVRLFVWVCAPIMLIEQ